MIHKFREVCDVDIRIGLRDRSKLPMEVTRRVFARFRGCRVLAARFDGPRLFVRLLLPGDSERYDLTSLTDFINFGIQGQNVDLACVQGLREATAQEILQKFLSSGRTI